MRPAFGLLALVAVALAYAWPMQVTGDNQNAHYALVKALSRGQPNIDDTLGETGDLQSRDVARHDGRLYTVKAPGLAMAATPTYTVVDRVGVRTSGDPTRVLWVLNLMTSVVASVALLFVVRAVAERLEPRFGTATAVITGLGALTLPFATLFFSHALSTALVFGSFAVLVLRAPSRRAYAAAGVLAGAALVVEHSTWLVAAIVGAYAIARSRRLDDTAAFACGALTGVTPLLLFGAWAFGDPLHTPYTDYWATRTDFRPLAVPGWDGLSPQLFSTLGLPTLAPVLGAAVAGAVLLFRRGDRAEAAVCLAVPLALVTYFSANGAFGGLGPPRYLTPIMPFLLLPLGLALRRLPVTTLALAAITCFQAVVMTATGPLAAYDWQWLSRAVDREFVATAASFVGVTGWYAIAPFFLAALAATMLAVASLPPLRPKAPDAATAVGAVAVWAAWAHATYNDWGRTPDTGYVLAVLAAVAFVSLAWLASDRVRTRAQVAT